MTAVLFISLIVLLIIGVPIAFVLCGSSILVFWYLVIFIVPLLSSVCFRAAEALHCWQYHSLC